MSPGPQDDRIDDLLVLWEEKREQGEVASAESLCAKCPDLAVELARRIQALMAMDRLVNVQTTALDASPGGLGGITSATTRQVHYTDLRFHAEGGLGEVFTAQGDDFGRRVALKFIRPRRAADPESRHRFLFEAEVTGRLEHPGVVSVYGLGADDRGLPCYAMRSIGGETLQDALSAFHEADRTGRAPAHRSRDLRGLLLRFISVCNTVAYAHSRGVLHRDLKPKNVMLGAFGETLVVDWGLAKSLAGAVAGSASDELLPVADTGIVPFTVGPIGTPGYMSPEQARNELVGTASDTYSLGAMLYAVLTSRPPFTGSTVEVIERTRRNEFPPARAVNPAVHPALEAVCAKAMATRPDDRYADPRELAADIDRWLAGAPVSACRDPLWDRVRRWARRNRTAVTAASASLVAGLIGLTVLAIVQAQYNITLSNANGVTRQALADTREAKQATDWALTQSESSRRKAEAVLAFLKDDILAAARPEGEEGGLGIGVTIRKAVDAAEPKIDKEFKGQPVVEADVRDTLGNTYCCLGEPRLAIRQFERVLELPQSALGPEHSDTLNSRTNLADAYVEAGLIAEAVALQEATLKLYEATLGPDHRDTLNSRNTLARAKLASGRIAEAVALHEATLKLRQSVLGLKHLDTLASRNNLSTAYVAADRATDALTLDEETLKLYESALGPKHPFTLTSRNNLAAAYFAAGRIAEALVLDEGTLKLRESVLGPDHPNTLISRGNLAEAYAAAGRWAKAEPLMRDLLERRRRAIPLDNRDLASDLGLLGLNLLMQSKSSEAEPVLRECLAIREKVIPDDWRHFNTMSQLGGAVLGQGRHAEAAPLVIRGYEGIKAREAKIPAPARVRVLQAALRVVQLYEFWGRPQEAAAWKARIGLRDLWPAPHFLVQR